MFFVNIQQLYTDNQVYNEFEEFDNTSDMNVDVTIAYKQGTVCYRDTEIQTDFTFPPDILCSLCTLPDTKTGNSPLLILNPYYLVDHRSLYECSR